MTTKQKFEVLDMASNVEVLLQLLKYKLRMTAWGENPKSGLGMIAGAKAMLTKVELLLNQTLNNDTPPQLNKHDVSRSACDCGVPLDRTKHSDLMFGDWYKDIEAYYCPKCGELHSVDEF